MLELQWPTLQAQRYQSSLLLLHKVHCGTMSIDIRQFPSFHRSKLTRSSHSSQYIAADIQGCTEAVLVQINLGNFKGGHFHLISGENKAQSNISPFTVHIMLKMAHPSFTQGPFDE